MIGHCHRSLTPLKCIQKQGKPLDWALPEMMHNAFTCKIFNKGKVINKHGPSNTFGSGGLHDGKIDGIRKTIQIMRIHVDYGYVFGSLRHCICHNKKPGTSRGRRLSKSRPND